MIDATREIFWNIDGRAALYAMAVPAAAAFGFGMVRRIRLWRRGQGARRIEEKRLRAWSALTLVLGHRRLLRKQREGAFHLLLFWGMILLLAGTVTVALRHDLGWDVMRGGWYLYFMSLVLDAAGVAVLVGLLAAIRRRHFGRVGAETPRAVGGIALWLLTAVVLTGFLVEGARIAATRDPWGPWSPAGYAFALMLRGAGMESLHGLHRFAWWTHSALSLFALGYVPFSGLIHAITAPLNTYYRSLGPMGATAPLDLDEDGDAFGVRAIEDFSWKDLLDLDACAGCGRCEEICPAWLTGKPLSPARLIGDLKDRLSAGRPRPGNGLIAEDALWACTTCGACTERCPAFVEHVPKIVAMRRGRVLMESRFPPELTPVFRNMETQGNAWGLSREKRAEWAEGLGVKVVARDGTPEYLFWVGCAGSFDDRNRKVAAATARILKEAGVDFAILGTEESCCGDSARRLGNEYLAQLLLRETRERLARYGVAKVVTACPHCFNMFRNEISRDDPGLEVVHHTELIARSIGSGRLKLRETPRGCVTYQDPCYLGRYNDLYRPPREVLEALRLPLSEMSRSRDDSFCCGGGGGRIWMEENIGARINGARTEEALASGAGSIVTACPYCLTMMEDGVRMKDGSDDVTVLDLAEIVAEALST